MEQKVCSVCDIILIIGKNYPDFMQVMSLKIVHLTAVFFKSFLLPFTINETVFSHKVYETCLQTLLMYFGEKVCNIS